MYTIDLHCDTISGLLELNRKNPVHNQVLRSNSLHIDLEKLQKSSYLLQNFALFIHLPSVKDPFEEFLIMTDLYYNELEKNKDMIAPVYSFRDIEENQRNKKISSLLTIEEGGCLKGSLVLLRTAFRLGVRMITLTWNYPNEIGFPNVNLKACGESSHHATPDFIHPNTENGLTALGLEFIQEMESLGIIIDVSHLSDAGFYDVLHHTAKPFMASHSNAREVCLHNRNLSDSMIKSLSSRGGIMGLNFCPDFLGSQTIECVTAHARHIYKAGGIECLALGSDFDGIEGHEELKDASFMPRLYDALLKSGFTSEQADRIFYKNALRFYKDTLPCAGII